MPWTEHADGPAPHGPTGELCPAQVEAAALRRQVAELEADLERLITGLCYAALHDGRGGRVGLPLVWRSCLGGTRHPEPS